MATETKTWAFVDSTEYNTWTQTISQGTQTRSYDSGNQRAQIQSETGRNKTSDGHMEITGTFASIFGIGTGDTVTGYSAASFNGGCSAYATMDSVLHGELGGGPAMDVNDGTLRTLISTQSTYTAAGQTRSPTIDSAITGLSLPGSTSITIRVHDDFDNANDNNAGATIWVDNISLSIEVQSAQQFTENPTDTVVSSDPSPDFNIGKAPTNDSSTASDVDPTFAIGRGDEETVVIAEDFSPVTDFDRALQETASVLSTDVAKEMGLFIPNDQTSIDDTDIAFDISKALSLQETVITSETTPSKQIGLSPNPETIAFTEFFDDVLSNASLTLRIPKGSALTAAEMDENFGYLNARLEYESSDIATGATITPSTNHYSVTGLDQSATINAPSIPTPENGYRLLLRIDDDGTSRTLSWNAIWRAIGITLPTATTPALPIYICAIYNSDDAKWDVITVV